MIEVTGKELAAKIRARVRVEREYLAVADKRSSLMFDKAVEDGRISASEAIIHQSFPTPPPSGLANGDLMYLEFLASHLKPTKVYALTAVVIRDLIVPDNHDRFHAEI